MCHTWGFGDSCNQPIKQVALAQVAWPVAAATMHLTPWSKRWVALAIMGRIEVVAGHRGPACSNASLAARSLGGALISLGQLPPYWSCVLAIAAWVGSVLAPGLPCGTPSFNLKPWRRPSSLRFSWHVDLACAARAQQWEIPSTHTTMLRHGIMSTYKTASQVSSLIAFET